MDNNIHIRQLGKSERESFFKKFKNSTPKYITNSKVYAVFYKLNYIGGIVLSIKTNNSTVSISYLYISPKYRRNGLGKELISKVCKKYNKITIETGSVSSKQINTLLLKLNFRIYDKIGKFKFWVWEKEQTNINPESLNWFCKKYSCKMLKSVCMKRQLLASLPSNFQKRSLYYYTCCDPPLGLPSGFYLMVASFLCFNETVLCPSAMARP